MKLSALFATVVFGSLIACSGSDDKSDTTSTEAATKPAATTDTTKPAESTDPGTMNAPAPTTDPAAATTDPTTQPTTTTPPVAEGPETCATLAAKAAAPAGKLTMTSPQGDAIDVYATEVDGTLSIVLTKTANTCSYRKNNLLAIDMNETRYDFKSSNGAFAAGDFKTTGMSHESGAACMPEDFQGGGFTGTAWSGGSARGKLTITAKTDTQVDGTVDVTDFDGNKTTFTFSAPICAAADPQADVTCCSE